MDEILSQRVKRQPALQETESSGIGAANLRHRRPVKSAALASLRALTDANAPWLRVRCAF